MIAFVSFFKFYAQLMTFSVSVEEIIKDEAQQD
jgi:hypothetical protein